MEAKVQSSTYRLMGIGLLMEAGFVFLGLPGISLPTRLGIQIALFGAYLAALREVARKPLPERSLKFALGLAALFRVTLLFAPPFYSDDLYRYLWDGHVQVTGHLNPFLYAPASKPLAPLRDYFFPRINHPEIPTIYPPVAQLFFAVVVLIHKSVPLLKGALALSDLALIWVLLRLLTRVGLPRGQVLIYAWSPLGVAEVAGNGHIDALAILFLIAGIHAIILERPALSTLALGLSAGSKLLPLLTFPVLLRRVRPRVWAAVPLLVVAATYVPYAGAGAALFAGLREYAERWQHNDSLFTPILRCVERLQPTSILKEGIARLHAVLDYPVWMEPFYHYAYPVYLTRLLCFGTLLALACVLAWRRIEPIRGVFLLLAAVLLLSPTVYPWYLLWIVPFLAIFPNRAWILLTGLVSLSYLDPLPVTSASVGRSWIRAIEYLPFFTLLLYDAVVSHRRGRGVTLFDLLQATPGRPAAGEQKERAGISPPSG